MPISVLGSGYLRRLIRAGSETSYDLIKQVDWKKFSCSVPGVRWHPSGAWRVTFKKGDMHHNFFVNCSCYFRVTQYGFNEAKRQAIAYRKRLGAEWFNLRSSWRKEHEGKLLN